MRQWLSSVLQLLLFLIISGNSHALEWQDLWQSSDQQAEQAFQQQKYDQAAGQFTNSEWKAAAEYKSENYQQVLETLKDINSSEAFYNKGNAYAQLRQFEQAMKAYEQALELDPDNNDAEYNKQLIEQQMDKQKQQQDQQQGEDDSSQQEQNNEDSQEQDQQNQQGEQQEQEGSQEKNQKDQEQKTGNENESNEQDVGEEQSQHQDDKENEDEQAQEIDQSREEQQQEEDKSVAKGASAEEMSKDEEQQANDQWLKRIPDNPGGLLKRKFKYQYQQRQRVPGRQAEQW